MTRLYLSNLPYALDSAALIRVAQESGLEVVSAKIICDHESGRSRGYGFLVVDNCDESAAIASLNGISVGGRVLHAAVATSPARRGNQ